MLRFHNYDIVFQEIPDEVTLAVNITGCPNRCPECHSKFLWADTGEPLNEESLSVLIGEYGSAITCLSFMGGDQEPQEVNRLAAWLRQEHPRLKIGWYSGRQDRDEAIGLQNFDFIKLGPYEAEHGSLKERTTNQRLYRVEAGGRLEDITSRFWKKH
ncbi:MAG: anaerobic ribonucleoside-triphosphate reductase activating protein [Bacteroidaceae bacterium]|nr:anaerobic ribonucleoside-triphosphate reductase activating protein [Bacteroidaceae bacterium]